jgi:aspartyl/asparaginyl-tRNA synthetase
MAIEEHYHETLDVLDNLLRFVFTELKKRYSREIEVVRQQFPSQDFTFPDKTVILSYREGLQMLKDDGVELEADADINTENEKRLGRLVKAKHGTDYYILDKFPLALRPFYTMPDAADPVSPPCHASPQRNILTLAPCFRRRCPTRTTSSCEARRSSLARSGCTTHPCWRSG